MVRFLCYLSIRNSDRKLVTHALKFKIEDAEWNANRVRRQFFMAKSTYRHTVRRNSMVDVMFKKMTKANVESLWRERKQITIR